MVSQSVSGCLTTAKTKHVKPHKQQNHLPDKHFRSADVLAKTGNHGIYSSLSPSQTVHLKEHGLIRSVWSGRPGPCFSPRWDLTGGGVLRQRFALNESSTLEGLRCKKVRHRVNKLRYIGTSV